MQIKTCLNINIKSLLNLVALLITLLVNGLANELPLNGQTTSEISAKVPVLFTPVPFTFAIWSIIYLFLMAFAFYQVLPSQQHAPFRERIGYWFIVSCGWNCLWLFLWHYEHFVGTLVAMAGLLGSLIMIYQSLNIGRLQVSRWNTFLVHVPFSLYLGWITAAALANIAIVLCALNLDSLRLPPILFTIILLLIATGLGTFMILRRNEIAYALAIAWALVGIAVRHQQTLPVLAIPAAALACAVVITLVFVRLDRNPELVTGIKVA